MATSDETPGKDASNAPIANFSHCHDGILNQLTKMGELPALVSAAERARQSAEAARRFFREVVFEHHQEEERALFEAVLASATPGAELERVTAITTQLTREHRLVEAQFVKMEPQLKKMAKGQACDLDVGAFETLVRDYKAHAAFEEAEFLPLSQVILSRNSNHMAALGLSLHIRHVSLAPSPT